MSGMTNQSNGGTPPNPYAPIGLPATFQVTPVAWSFAKLEALTPAGRETVWVIVFDLPSGRVGVPLPGEHFRRFVEMASAQLSGIEIARGGSHRHGINWTLTDPSGLRS